MTKVILTYGTFDLFHIGHLNVLSRLKNLGDKLVVGVSTDSFNKEKGKKTTIPYVERAAIVAGLRCVDEVFPEETWTQKPIDIVRHGVTIFGMGDDWAGKFDDLRALCEVVYLPRTPSTSSAELRQVLGLSAEHKASESNPNYG